MDQEKKESFCPECGRAVAAKQRARCIYCGAELPWAEPGTAEESEPSPEEIERLLGTCEKPAKLADGTTYPKACGACGEKLPAEHVLECPFCRVALRDPLTGKLISEKTLKGPGEKPKESFLLIMVTMLLLCVFLLGFWYALNRMMSGQRRQFRKSVTGPAIPAERPR